MALERRGGGAAEDNRGHWVWVGGPVPPGSDAITIWRVVSIRRRCAGSVHLLRHEEEHLRQWRELGITRFVVEYLGAYVRGRLHGYRHKDAYRLIPLEVEAEQAAVDAGNATNPRRLDGSGGDGRAPPVT